MLERGKRNVQPCRATANALLPPLQRSLSMALLVLSRAPVHGSASASASALVTVSADTTASVSLSVCAPAPLLPPFLKNKYPKKQFEVDFRAVVQANLHSMFSHLLPLKGASKDTRCTGTGPVGGGEGCHKGSIRAGEGGRRRITGILWHGAGINSDPEVEKGRHGQIGETSVRCSR